MIALVVPVVPGLMMESMVNVITVSAEIYESVQLVTSIVLVSASVRQ